MQICFILGYQPEGWRYKNGSESEQFDQRAAKNRFFVGVSQKFCVQDQVHVGMPVERHIGAEDDLADTGFRYEVTQTLIRNDNRIDENLVL